MAKKIDAKAAALAAAQGSAAVFDVLEDEAPVVAAEPKHDETEARADEAAAPTHDEPKEIPMNAQTFANATPFAPAIDAAAEKMRNMFNGASTSFDGKEMMERTQRLGIEHQGFQAADRHAVDQRRPARQLRHFAGELARFEQVHLDPVA